ncbi:MAG: hypothetical protein AAGJ18_20145, partial [Bacteroidota bacterium]
MKIHPSLFLFLWLSLPFLLPQQLHGQCVPDREFARIVHNNFAASDKIGRQVAYDSGILVASDFNSNNRIHIFEENSNGTFTNIQSINGSGSSNFGISIAIEDETIVVGSPLENN